MVEATRQGGGAVTTERRWKVEIFVDEHEDHTRAEARLVVPDGRPPRPPELLRGTGQSRYRVGEVAIQEIEDELAVSRALWDLAHVLWTTAVADLEAVVSGVGAGTR
jgi:Rv2632c-like